MAFPLEYHRAVQRSFPASLTLFGMLLLPLLLLSVSSASPSQISGAPSSAASSGFAGHAVSGAPSVMSTGHSNFAPSHAGVNFHNQISHSGGHRHHHNLSGDLYYYPYVYTVPVPYAADVNNDDPDADDDDSNYQGGPTIFDRRGAGLDSYIPPTYPGPAHARPDAGPGSTKSGSTGSGSAEIGSVESGSTESDSTQAADPPEPPQPPTVLVFKDGRQLEVGNYAIVSQTLYDLTPGHRRKIALADVDLSATEKQNDDRGVTFQLPPPAQAN